jgi:AraC family transcriptional regulator
MEPKIVERPAFTLVGMIYHGKLNGEEIALLWNTFGPRMGELRHSVNPQVSYGVMSNYDATSEEFDYLAACEVAGPADLPAAMTCFEVPAATYAVFPCTMSEIGPRYGYIMDTWLPQSGYAHGGGPEFEEYGPTFNPADPASEFAIYLPVERVA